MKRVFIFLISSILSIFAIGQTDSISQPKVQIKVKKQFDNNGNVIMYDSTVVTTWHSGNFNYEADSLYKNIMSKMPFDFSVISPDSMWTNFNKELFDISPLDIEEEFRKMDEMFMKSMQMMMMPPTFDNNFDKKSEDKHNKKTTKTIKENQVKIQPTKI